MIGTFIYLIGVPGSGKSTLMAELTRGLPVVQSDKPIAHRWYGDGTVMELGRQRDSFSGTDALSLSVQPRAIEWIRQHPARVILAEGDRLANDKFFQAVVAANYDFQLVYIHIREAEAERRRRARGSQQNTTWLAGRNTKVRHLLDRWGHHTVLAVDEAPAQVAYLRTVIPALTLLNNERYA